MPWPGSASDERVTITFAVGDAHALDFPDRAFDVAVSFRVLMHTPQWRVCLGELCRVADRLVVIDYPSRASLARLQAAARRAVSLLGVRTEAYRVFSDRRSEALRSTDSRSVRATGSSSCQSPFTRPSDHADSPPPPNRS